MLTVSNGVHFNMQLNPAQTQHATSGLIKQVVCSDIIGLTQNLWQQQDGVFLTRVDQHVNFSYTLKLIWSMLTFQDQIKT